MHLPVGDYLASLPGALAPPHGGNYVFRVALNFALNSTTLAYRNFILGLGVEMANTLQPQKEAAKALKTNEKKWTKVLMDSGWTAFPSVILERQKALGLDPLDVNILMHLSTYWWEADNKPHPAKQKLADAIGVNPRTVQRRIARLEKSGFIKREYRREHGYGNKSNKYHFDGLIEAITPFAKEKLEDRAQKEAESKARIKRKRPALKAIKGGKN